MKTRYLPIIAVLVAAAALLPRTSRGDAFSYASNRRLVRCGIVVSKALEVFDNSGMTPRSLGSENPDPHVLYVLDSRADLKPFGMEFVNPLGPTVVTSDIYKRWKDRPRNGFPDPALDPASPQGRIFRVGATVGKNMGCYWEVNVDNLSIEDLKQYDLLYLHSHVFSAAFSSQTREKLRHWVDAGGTFVIENCGRFSFARNAPFMFDFQFNTAYGVTSAAVLATPNHPILTQPYVIRQEQLPFLGDKGVNGFYIYNPYDPTDPAYYGGNAQNNGVGQDQYNPPAAHTLVPIVWNTIGAAPLNVGGVQKPNPAWRPYIMAGQVGAGKVIICSQDSGCAINDYVGGVNVGYGGNSGAVSGETLLAAKPVDLQFFYNVASWSGAHTTAQGTVRHSGGSPEKIGAVLVDKWTPPSSGGTFKVGGPVQYKNMVYAVDGNLVLHCYDSKPSEDLDGDHNPDDGIPDYITGLPYDEIWNLPLAPLANGAARGASTPTIVEFYDPNYRAQRGETTTVNGVEIENFNQRELVVITLSDGTVLAIRAVPRRHVPGYPLAPVSGLEWKTPATFVEYPIAAIDTTPRATVSPDVALDLPIPSPAWSEGVIFAAVNVSSSGLTSGRIVAIDPRNGLSAVSPGPTGYSGELCDRAIVPDVTPGQPPAISSPTVAFVRDAATGAIDKMVYVNIMPPLSGATASTPASVRGFWFGTRGEPLARINTTSWGSRADKPWYIYLDPLKPGRNNNPQLRQRIFHTFRDPDGTYATKELLFTTNASAAPGEFKVEPFSGNQQKVTLASTQSTPKGVIATDDERNSYFADYCLDWDVAETTKVNARTVMNLPDVSGGGSRVAGAPAVSPDDLVYYSVTTAGTSTNTGRGVLFAVNEQFARTSLRWAYTLHDGFQMQTATGPVTVPPRLRQLDPNPALWQPAEIGSFLNEVQFFGTPAYKDGVIYAMARGKLEATSAPVSVLCAFSANPEFKLRLTRELIPPIRVRQMNVVTSQNLGTANPSAYMVELNPAQYTYSGGREIRINAMSAPGTVNNFVSASLPFLVSDSGGELPPIGNDQVDIVNGVREVRIVGAPGVDNLLWYMVIPGDRPLSAGGPVLGFVSSSPTVQGDQMWIGFQRGAIASINAVPDASFQQTGGQIELKVKPAASRGNIWVKQVGALTSGSLPVITQAPVAANNLLAVGTFNGVLGLEDSFTVIADNKRLLEVNSGGEAVWTSDGTRTFGYSGGERPNYIYDEGSGNVVIGNPLTGTGVPVVQTTPFARPMAAKRVSPNELLVVDTGNNRIIMIDRGSNVLWEVNRLFDDFKRQLRPGDPLTLNEPTDIEYWQEFNNNINVAVNLDGTVYSFTGPGYIVHYLIADTGNFRVIELVDVYDVNGNPVRPSNGMTPAPFAMLRQVNFISSSYALAGKRYRYRSVQRVFAQNKDVQAMFPGDKIGLGLNPTDIRQLTLSAISNARIIGGPTNAVNAGGDVTESSGGSLVLLDEKGDPLSVISNLRIPDASQPSGFRLQPIVNPTWFSKFDQVSVSTGALVFKYLLCDDNGCYQLTPASATDMNVEWMLGNDDYYAMTGKKLRASSMKRLSTAVATDDPTRYSFQIGLHHFLITNKFSGEDNPKLFGIIYNTTGIPANGNIQGSARFNGEVFELDPTFFNWNAGHGYIPDFMPGLIANSIAPNPAASIIWRCPTQTVPTPGVDVGYLFRSIGDNQRATSTSLLEQPAYADRTF